MKMSRAARILDLARRYDSAQLEARVNRPIFGLLFGAPRYQRPSAGQVLDAVLQVRYIPVLTRHLNNQTILLKYLDKGGMQGNEPPCSYPWLTPPASMLPRKSA
jgi:hypothetical protein